MNITKNNYKVGQVVSLRLPRTYGEISAVLKGPEFDEEPVYSKGGFVVEPMHPILGADKKPLELDYSFDNPDLSWKVQIINPAQELQRLRVFKRGGTITSDGVSLEEAIRYLSRFVG